ncbi:hypothetical protein [Acinetobacter sp. ANC 4178]|jgi:hypothetical protein|uniref:hypothetical protein n=1 Tax=Acinetobacter sp. ANC 4178 TaxID=2529839 RepID=UPI001039C5E0|nr:hypothetical protein [Acinetobacter sp. ANC 4178]TCB64997.1 hypothetical protein E0H87_14330 [Acinetobacter sp. ANC 4178]
MKKLLQGALLPFGIFVAAISLFGCNQATEQDTQTANSTEVEEHSPANHDTETELKNGNMIYVVRDVADMQLKAGDYVQQLKQTQTDLEQALADKDQQALQTSVNALHQQLTDFNRALSSLDLKSQEIESIRQKVMSTNQQILDLPYLNGKVELESVNLHKIEQQVTSVQTEMLKLAKMLLLQPESSEKS